jgi:DNA-binding Lrp family transcriptional regulator
MLSVCVLIRTLHGKDSDVVKSLSQLESVKKIFSVLGRYDVVVDLVVSDIKELGNIVMRIGRFYGVVFTETLIEIQK